MNRSRAEGQAWRFQSRFLVNIVFCHLTTTASRDLVTNDISRAWVSSLDLLQACVVAKIMAVRVGFIHSQEVSMDASTVDFDLTLVYIDLKYCSYRYVCLGIFCVG